MSVETFLQSGLLETYVLGQCSPEEWATVEKMLARHESVRDERDRIEAALFQYANTFAVTPPEWMRGRIMDNINQDVPKLQQGNRLVKRVMPLLIGLAALALVMFWNYRQQQALQQQIDQQSVELRACTDRESELQQANVQMAFLTDPNTRAVPVKWLDPANTSGKVMAYYNPVLQQTFIKTDALPALAANEDYQFWIVVKGKESTPIPMSVFGNSDALIKMGYEPDAVNFAVSIEPKGGSPNGIPTKVVMLG